jgi:hypothetical protein
MVLEGVLAEFVQHNAYATNSYLQRGPSAGNVLQGQDKVKLQVLSLVTRHADPKAPTVAHISSRLKSACTLFYHIDTSKQHGLGCFLQRLETKAKIALPKVQKKRPARAPAKAAPAKVTGPSSAANVDDADNDDEDFCVVEQPAKRSRGKR